MINHVLPLLLAENYEIALTERAECITLHWRHAHPIKLHSSTPEKNKTNPHTHSQSVSQSVCFAPGTMRAQNSDKETSSDRVELKVSMAEW